MLDDNTFVEELNRIYDVLLHYALNLNGNDELAFELLQRTIVRAYIKRSTYICDSNFAAWIKTIMRNLFVDTNVSCTFKIHSIDDMDFDNAASCPSCTISCSSELYDIIDELPCELSAPLKLHIEGYKYREISSMLGLPVTTIKNRLHMARVRLRVLLCDYIE